MPKALEEKLKKEAAKKGLKGDKSAAYVYGTMQKVGKKPNASPRRFFKEAIKRPDIRGILEKLGS